MANSRRDKADSYTQRAHKEGYPARSVYKLEEINATQRLIKPGDSVLDVGAAPGSWTLYTHRELIKGKGKIVSVDLNPLALDPIPPTVIEFTGDAFSKEIRAKLVEEGPYDAIISDALNHASIIDGVRLCKAKRYRYANADMEDLERCLKEAQVQRYRIIATDGVFSMDGNVAPMDKICELAEKYDALVMVDESHSAGVVGPTGHGVAEQFGLYGKIDIFTGTLGKSFGGAMGGFTTGRKEIIDMLRQRSRPYLFSNSVAPAIVGASLEMFKMLKEDNAIHAKLMENVTYFRDKMLAAGFDIKPTQSAICAVMLYDAKLSQDFAARMQEEGIYVTGFYYPVVPKGQARIRVQLSAGHEREHLDKAVNAFIKVGKELNVIK